MANRSNEFVKHTENYTEKQIKKHGLSALDLKGQQ